MTERVQIPAYTDRWMMGDRYGEVLKVTKKRADIPPRHYVTERSGPHHIEIAHIKLDKSGKTVRVVYADCTIV